jgi:hypothetical protein
MPSKKTISPWRKENAVSTMNQGKKYGPSTDDMLRRGEIRRAIEDRLLQKELNDDPLFADREMIGNDADYGIEVGDS